jgi:peptidyl-tRNA hydrolase, PTH1 family
MPDPIEILVGLGNPGSRYAANRHNIGFMALDAMARRWSAGPWRKRFQGECADVVVQGQKVLLLKPQTYMNESGRAVAEALGFYKLPLSSIAVFHDELDLAPAKLRAKVGGGNAGHNGLRSISAHAGNDYLRLRMGIGHPGDKDQVHAYVLGDFARQEQGWVDDLCRLSADLLPWLVKGDSGRYQSDIALEMRNRGWDNMPLAVGKPEQG